MAPSGSGTLCPSCAHPLDHVSNFILVKASVGKQEELRPAGYQRFYCATHGYWRVYPDGRIVADGA